MTFSSLNDISFLQNKKLAPSCNYNPFSRRYQPQSAITFRNRLAKPAVPRERSRLPFQELLEMSII